MAIDHIDDPVAEVIELRRKLAEVDQVIDTTQQLRDRVDHLLARITGPAPLNEVRQAMNDVGIHDARRQLTVDAVDLVEHALTDLRKKQDTERAARETYEEAVTEAAWALDAHFTSRSNKTWLALTIDGTPIDVDAQQSYDAKAKAEWINHHAAKTQPVLLAKRALRAAEEDTAQARDALAVAEKRFTAARHSLDAAAAQLTGLIRCTPREDLR